MNYKFADIYHDVMNFISFDLSAFYLDFAKDVLYIEAEKTQFVVQCKLLFMNVLLH